ncbi:MAG: DNA2/NAM7 family helicase [Bacteroidaceae bacterium]|nr:DNA2/NAM7 family helicase [Bacteroidaceae bacterium]
MRSNDAILTDALPASDVPEAAEVVRLVVDGWDERFIVAHPAGTDAGGGSLRVFYGGRTATSLYKEGDWSYLRPMLRRGGRLNALCPQVRDGVVTAALLVWEPDYLVDISAIASCFETYGTSPLAYLLRRLKPAVTSEAILLGELAGQFLREEVGAAAKPATYAESAMTFFHENALRLLCTGVGSDFHTKAKAQRANVRHLLRGTLAADIAEDATTFFASGATVEPSFFCEALGLQGRMDFLHAGRGVVIEQKAGRGDYRNSSPDKPAHRENHRVQLLLYMLLLRYGGGLTPAALRQLRAYLLYSRNGEGLLPVEFDTAAAFWAMKLRNEIVADEYAYSLGGYTRLRSLDADALNTRHVGGPLWERYQRPQIEALLAPVRTATELEFAYYSRFLAFLSREHWLAKVGAARGSAVAFADKWRATSEEKRQAGDLLCGLTLRLPAEGAQGVTDVLVLDFAQGDGLTAVSNFRKGDIVVVYPYSDGAVPDVRHAVCHRGVVAALTDRSVTVSLLSPQAGAASFYGSVGQRWAVEHDYYESSFTSLCRGMQAFLTAPKERRDLLLFNREPRIDRSQRLCGDYGAANEMVLRGKRARDMFLIIGPPGTGKTSLGLLTALKEELLSGDGAVLLLSFTNRAVDEACAKLAESGIDFIRLGGKHAADEAFRLHHFATRAARCANADELRAEIARTRVFAATTAATATLGDLFKLKRFSLAIVDEASQILEPHIVGLLSATAPDGTPAIGRFILIGDHKQLPAVVQTPEADAAVAEPALRAIGLDNCRQPLFQRLLRRYRDNADVVYMLTRQGRMHPDIAAFPNEAFYGSRLCEVPLPHQATTLPRSGRGRHGIEDLLLTRRLAFVAVPAPQEGVADKVNADEATAIAATVAKIYEMAGERFDPATTVGVIVPYRNQACVVRAAVDSLGIAALAGITIDTVERFQGSQRDAILYGFTARKPEQLAFLTESTFEEDGALIDRKLNVAMTRARECLLLFGNPDLLASVPVFHRLLDFVRRRGGYIDVSPADYCSGRFQVAPRER